MEILSKTIVEILNDSSVPLHSRVETAVDYIVDNDEIVDRMKHSGDPATSNMMDAYDKFLHGDNKDIQLDLVKAVVAFIENINGN